MAVPRALSLALAGSDEVCICRAVFFFTFCLCIASASSLSRPTFVNIWGGDARTASAARAGEQRHEHAVVRTIRSGFDKHAQARTWSALSPPGKETFESRSTFFPCLSSCICRSCSCLSLSFAMYASCARCCTAAKAQAGANIRLCPLKSTY